jgi:hypothetical protein
MLWNNFSFFHNIALYVCLGNKLSMSMSMSLMKALIKIRCDFKMQFYDGGRIFSQPPNILVSLAVLSWRQLATLPPSFPCRTGPAGSEQILRSSHTHKASPPSPPPPGGAGGWRGSPNSRHSTTNKAVRRRPRSTLKIYRINNKVEWKVKYASLSYFTG